METCENCKGPSDFTFEIAPTWGQREVTIIDNRVIIPRSLRPENICFDKLHNVNLDFDDPVELGENVGPLFFDASVDGDGNESCAVRIGDWPCPVVVEDWDITTTPEPPADDCDCGTGQIKMFREVSSGCLSHVCVDGDLFCLPTGGGGSAPGTPTDTVCYDLSDWDFPVSYGGSGGSWEVYGVDQINEPCSSGPASFTPTNLQYACWDDWGGIPGPTTGWNSLNWVNDTGVAPQNTNFPPEIMATADSHGCSRPAFRVDPGFTSGTSGPFTWQIDFTIPGGNTRWAAYDIISGQQLPATILSQPAGGTAQVEAGPNGPTVFAPSGGTPGIYTFEFQLPAGVNASNVRYLAWNMGNGSPSNPSVESFTINEITAVPSTSDCCFVWTNEGSVAAYLNSVDPGDGSGWVVTGNQICATFPGGVGGNYGALSSCDNENTLPDIESIVSGGGGTSTGGSCPNCVTIVDNGDGTATAQQSPATNVSWGLPCGVDAPNGQTGTRSGHFVDSCQELDAAGWNPGVDKQAWLEANYPAAGFVRWWRQGVEFSDGGSFWGIVNVGGNLTWIEL